MEEAVTFLLSMLSVQPRPWSQLLSTSSENFLHQLPSFYASSMFSLKYFPIRKVNIIRSFPSLLKHITHFPVYFFFPFHNHISQKRCEYLEPYSSIHWKQVLLPIPPLFHTKPLRQKWIDTVLDTINFICSLISSFVFHNDTSGTSLGLLFSSLQGNHFFCLYPRYHGSQRCHSQSSALLSLPRRFLSLFYLQLYFKYINDNQILVASLGGSPEYLN